MAFLGVSTDGIFPTSSWIIFSECISLCLVQIIYKSPYCPYPYFFFFYKIAFFSFYFIFLLKPNCFTEFCCFLSNLNMNQPWVYIYPLHFEPPSHLLPHPALLDWCRALIWVSWATQQIPIGCYFAYSDVSFHVTVSIRLTLSKIVSIALRSRQTTRVVLLLWEGLGWSWLD